MKRVGLCLERSSTSCHRQGLPSIIGRRAADRAFGSSAEDKGRRGARPTTSAGGRLTRPVDSVRVVSRGTARWNPETTRPLRGNVALVAGGTRGVGRATAVCLGAAGATVYVTGRSTSGHLATTGRAETIDGTIELVREAGGNGVAMRVDHTKPR